MTASPADVLEVVGIATGAGLVVAVLGRWLLQAVLHRSILASVTVVALAMVAVMAAGIVAVGEAMFLSGHDLEVLLVVVAVTGAIGVAGSLTLGRAVVTGSRALGHAARTLGDGTPYDAQVAPPTAELAALSAELAATSARLAAAQERQRSLEGSRRELVAWVSHDLRTPLAGLRAMVEAVEDQVVDDPADVARYHAQMRVEVDRLAGMVDDLFELSRIQSGTMRLSMRAVPLPQLVSAAVAATNPLAAAKGVRLSGAADPAVVSGSEPELGRVLRNLLTNAIRHTPSGGTVSVRAGFEGGSGYVAVSDACGGIPAEDLPRLFDMAFRAGPARTPGGGAGLGLAISHGIVAAHAGELRVANEGAGCRFVVCLPLAASPAGA